MTGSDPLGGVAARADLDGLVAPVVVACSGGPDSTALLALAAHAGLAPVAVHVDHGLRPSGAAEAAVVEALARHLGVPCRAVRVEVRPGPNLEARARDVRYEALAREAAGVGATAILTGHSADDLAETVVLNLLRGSGTSGLAGIPARRGTIVRPLLDVRRADLHALAVEVAAAAGVEPVVDPTNEDERFRRNWVRRTVLPLLGSGAERDLVPVIARQARVMAEEADLLDALADELLAAAGPAEPAVAALRGAPRALVRRALRRWLGPPWPSLADLDRVEAVLDGTRRATEIAGGVRVSRSDGRLRRGLACAIDADANDEGDA